MPRSGPGVIAFGAIIVLGIIFGIVAFKSCYDDHRNQLGFSVLTSITSCSGG